MGEFEGDADSGEISIGIGAVDEFWIERRDAVGNFGGGFMVVGDDDIDFASDGFFDFIGGCDAAIDRDEERAFIFSRIIEGIEHEAFFKSIRLEM